jgi:uncharacterized protein YecT (DUF1311 family)
MRMLALALALTTLSDVGICQTAKPAHSETRLRQEAAAVVVTEISQRKLTHCLDNHTADRQVTCPQQTLGIELDRSNKNYVRLVRAINRLLQQYNAGGNSTEERDNATTLGTDLDAAESAWANYRDAECETISEDLHGGMMMGHPWLYESTFCKLVVTHQHVYELSEVYGWLWRN